ncbi:MAG TPA: hypothetical protein ACFYEK_01075 [Candidatus Wunengus sp. YC60]|uniref:hypothetical protein n=1 Tax=Candidatus Wunengus sp. YC60 TaxID=3367697 RepID=UPI004026C554
MAVEVKYTNKLDILKPYYKLNRETGKMEKVIPVLRKKKRRLKPGKKRFYAHQAHV